jgi:hypothetical protein
VRLAVQELLGTAAADDRLPAAPERSAEKLPVCSAQTRGEVAALHQALSLFHPVGKVRRPDLELAHPGVQPRERIRVVAW